MQLLAELWQNFCFFAENWLKTTHFCKKFVYEHAPKESLDRHLSSTNFTWRQRLKTCIGAARGLSFLHDAPAGTNERIIHRDIKSANILLDANWNAKVSDMGLSKIAPANQQRTGLVTQLAGTAGYCDPSYMETYCLTKESDVYSFGVEEVWSQFPAYMAGTTPLFVHTRHPHHLDLLEASRRQPDKARRASKMPRPTSRTIRGTIHKKPHGPATIQGAGLT
ncbi:putative protein kinase RLK-Pelle-CrRLK1L-1 family [Helianthus annuus]|nr:putative protein kinase RLK-Pelle-CrRLK1L-1 family [Helianthus annuus]